MARYATRGRWKPAEHLLLLNRKLMDLAAGRIKRLMVFMPPRHGKSTLVSHYFPVWYLFTHPGRQIILASYEASYAATWGGRVRDTIAEFGEDLAGVTVRSDKRAASDFQLRSAGAHPRWASTVFGGMKTAGVGTGVTGRGGSILMVDDPVKDAEQAQSAVYREKAWDWWLSTFSTRREGEDTAYLLIMTRWHEDDLAGRLITRMQEGKEQRWEILNLPALATAEGGADPLGREPQKAECPDCEGRGSRPDLMLEGMEGPPPCFLCDGTGWIGEALWPDLYSRNFLLDVKREYEGREYWWNALFQQRPTAPQGQIVRRDWFQFYDEAPAKIAESMDVIEQSWDCAFKGEVSSHPVAGEVWGRSGADRYLLHVENDRMDFNATKDRIRATYRRWPMTNRIWVEDKANGPAVINSLQNEIPVISPWPDPSVPEDSYLRQESKESRLNAVVDRFRNGNVYLPDPERYPWVKPFIEEMVSFPKGRTDDLVDACTMQMIQWEGPEPTEVVYDFEYAGGFVF